jgi:hypothetical protein
MPHPQRGHLAVDHSDGWSAVAVEGHDIGGGLAASTLAMPAFFFGWIALGLLFAVGLARRGHDRRTMLTLGVGLGPLMLVVASDVICRREREARALLLAPGLDHGGDLDIFVLLQDRPEHVRSVVPTLDAVKADVGRLVISRAVDYEWLEDDLDNEVVDLATSDLVAARELVPIAGPALVVCPGAAGQARRFAPPGRRTLVLVAIGESSATRVPR